MRKELDKGRTEGRSKKGQRKKGREEAASGSNLGIL